MVPNFSIALLAQFCGSVKLFVDFLTLIVYNTPGDLIHHSVDISHVETWVRKVPGARVPG